MFLLSIVIHTARFQNLFRCSCHGDGGVSLSTNQRLYRFLVKPRFELVVFPANQSRLSVYGALSETAECLDDFETNAIVVHDRRVCHDFKPRIYLQGQGNTAHIAIILAWAITLLCNVGYC